MLGRNEPRKALALALSRLVLSHETTLRHAQTVLHAPELLEVPARASALDLWMAVLQRAEAEARVQRLVESVLEENPGAEALEAALRNFGLQEAAAVRAQALSVTAPGSARQRAAPARAPKHASDVLRPALLVVGGLVLAWRLVYWQAGERSDSSAERPTAEKSAPLRALGARDVAPTGNELRTQELRAEELRAEELRTEELRAELLACWRNSEGGDPETPAASVGVTLVKGPPGQSDQAVFSGSSLSVAPRFERCARAAGTRLLLEMTPGLSIEARLVLQSQTAAVAEPSRAGQP